MSTAAGVAIKGSGWIARSGEDHERRAENGKRSAAESAKHPEPAL
jgi:predicted nucleic acid-binding Zn ribbon protein